MSESNSNKSPDTDSSSRVTKLGKLFKRKRRENKWTKKEVAKTLLLSVSHIEALENDEYDKLPGTTYIIGYWRSYASLLKIDISESIEFHKNNLVVSPSTIALEANHRRAQGHQENDRKRSGLIFIVLSVIFLSGIWYWQNPDDTPLNQWFGDDTNHQGPLLEMGIDDGNQAVNGEDIPASIPEPEQPYSDILPEPNFFDDLIEADVEEGTPPNQFINNNGSDSGTVSSLQQQQMTEPVIKPVADSVAESAGETPVVDSPNWIFLNIEKRGWLDVRDVTGEKLIYRIANEGESIALKGTPPFYVFIEIVDGVQVDYLGKPIPFVADDDGVARFQVGSAGKRNQ